MGKVYRQQRVKGVTTPAIMNNLNYYYTNLIVYEDGIIDCWEKSHIVQFKAKLNNRRVLSSIPDGSLLSVYNLANLEIKEARWNYNADEFYEYIKSVLLTINPEIANIYSTTQRELDEWENANVLEKPIPYKINEKFGHKTLKGETNYCFYKQDNKVHLTCINAYSDKTLSIDVVKDKLFSLEEIESFFDNKTLLTSVSNKDEWIYIDGLGEILVDFSTSNTHFIGTSEKKKEIIDLVKSVSGEKDSLKICTDAYHEYLTDPTERNREALRKTYNAVPEQNRCFLGDMDTRDSDYDRILNDPKNKREV